MAKLEKELSESTTTVNNLEKTLSLNKSTIEDLQKENDLIILELHHVQEELANYILNTVDKSKLDKQISLTETTQEKLDLANEKYSKITAQVAVLKAQLVTEYEKLANERKISQALNSELKIIKNSKLYRTTSFFKK